MPLFDVQTANTILYCRRWRSTMRFYRDLLGFPIHHAADWFVEFQVTEDSFISIADAARSTIVGSDGNGITLTFQVTDLNRAHRNLTASGIAVGPILSRWGARVFYFHDPEGHRLEAWCPLQGSDSR
jgi:catechol 2,3-dioxygenase-like lactoylglutathione lyase family enzyme